MVLACPAADRYRIRMLQLAGDVLQLFKPSLQTGRAPQPCLVIHMDDVRDIRATHDTREPTASAATQCHPKHWGLTLEGGHHSVFTFYTTTKADMRQWTDVLKNAPLFRARPPRTPIPVHPIAVIQSDEVRVCLLSLSVCIYVISCVFLRY